MATSPGATSNASSRTESSWRRGTLASTLALVVGATFLLIGILGFVPGVTPGLGDIKLLGHESGAELLGLFQVSVLHNIVHLLFGVVGLWAARRADIAVTYLVAGGAVYLVLTLYGVVIDRTSDANFVPLNEADNWLHLGLGLGMVGLGALAAAAARRDPASRREGAVR